MASIVRPWLGLWFLVLSAPCFAQSVQLPSVPVGGALAARVTLSSLGAPSLAGIPITLTVPGGCGTFQGRPSIEVITDSAASFDFLFTPGTAPGVCTIQGRNGNFVGTASTTIYRPADVTFNADAIVRRVAVGGGSTVMHFTARAANVPLYGVPVTIDPPVGANGSSGSLVPGLGPTTNQNGVFDVSIQPNGVVGFFDFFVHALGLSQRVRVVQAPPDALPAPPNVSMAVDDSLALVRGATRVSLVNPRAGCLINSAAREETPPTRIPAGVADFPQGTLRMFLQGCTSTTTLKVDYPVALPENGVVYREVASATTVYDWAALPGSISGKSATFTVADDSLLGNGFVNATIGVARPGTPANIPAPSVHDMWWVGTAENGWGLSMAQSADGAFVFGAVYAYDDTGKPMWWVFTSGWDTQRATLGGVAYSTYGTPFDAYDTRFTIVNTAGAATITPTDAGHATFDYNLGGVAGRKSLQRQLFGTVDSTPVPSVNGMWWGGSSQSGWGVSIVQQYATLFSIWYTYDDQGRPTWYVMPGGRWTNSTTYEGRIYRTHGSPWLGRTYDASQLQVTDVGPYRFTFNGANASFAYTIDGKAGTLALTRQSPF